MQEEGVAVIGRAFESCLQSSKAGEEISEGHFWIAFSVWEAGPHIRLNAGFRTDLEWWHAFVVDWNSATMIWGGGGD